jgi:hypothetical protein
MVFCVGMLAAFLFEGMPRSSGIAEIHIPSAWESSAWHADSLRHIIGCLGFGARGSLYL